MPSVCGLRLNARAEIAIKTRVSYSPKFSENFYCFSISRTPRVLLIEIDAGSGKFDFEDSSGVTSLTVAPGGTQSASVPKMRAKRVEQQRKTPGCVQRAPVSVIIRPKFGRSGHRFRSRWHGTARPAAVCTATLSVIYTRLPSFIL